MKTLHLTQINPIYPAVESIVIEEAPFVIGRSSTCDQQMAAPTISRMHCRITCEGDIWFVQDLESRNGTYVNERRLSVTEALEEGDQLRIAFTTFRVSIGAPKRQKRSTPSGVKSN